MGKRYYARVAGSSDQVSDVLLMECGCEMVWTGNATRWWPRRMCGNHTDSTLVKKPPAGSSARGETKED